MQINLLFRNGMQHWAEMDLKRSINFLLSLSQIALSFRFDYANMGLLRYRFAKNILFSLF